MGTFPERPKRGKFENRNVEETDSTLYTEFITSEKTNHFRNKGIIKVAAIEARGYIWGGVIAYQLEAGFVLIRKPGKLPAETISESYELEYGTDSIEMHRDAIEEGEKVLVFDDLLATGGTAKAACNLVEKAGGVVVGVAFIIELTGSLHGRDKLKDYNVVSLIEIPVEE